MGGCVLLCLALVALTGGDLRRLAELRLRSTPLLFLALAVQVLITDIVEGDAPRPLLISAHLATYGLAGVFVWHNRHVPGLALLSVGAACNAVTIALNGGTLPASAEALRRAGIHISPAEFTNSGVLPHPRLGFLGDVFAVPAGWPLANVFSIGDVLIVLGAAWCLHRACRRPVEGVSGAAKQLTLGTTCPRWMSKVLWRARRAAQ